ncbi:LON peptidase substrate-binding domain-containing protein [Gordonia hirsuta]
MTVLPMFPLEHPLLPGEPLHLNVFEPRYRALVRDVLSGDGDFGVVLIARGSEVGGGDERHDIGTVTRIVGHRQRASGQIELACRGIDRLRVIRWLDDDPYPRAQVEPWPDAELPAGQAWTHVRGPFLSILAEIQGLYDDLAVRRGRPSTTLGAPESLPATDYTFLTAANLPLGAADRYAALCAAGPAERLDVLVRALDDVQPLLQDRLQT